MKQSVYVETSVVSYLTAWPSTDLVMRGNQEVTKRWWRDRAKEFDLFTSRFVVDEASKGDAKAAEERLSILNTIAKLDIVPEVEVLAGQLLANGALPLKARVDALHLAVATLNGMRFLATWNCKHLANAVLWDKINATFKAAGYGPASIVTPYELLGENQ